MPWMDDPTEDTILALLDFLVDPLLPSKSSSSLREVISPAQEELVAKQVHAVVLLYNYYHRKQHPELEFLEFESFFKMAVGLKPSLLSYLKLMQREYNIEVDDLDKQHSLTEKAIINGCNICKSLDASINNPIIEGWPITKIAVFLVDSNKENCYLFHSSITQGVWSVIEKDVNDPNQSSEAVTEAKPGNKKKRVAKRAPKENQVAHEASLQQFACLAVKEACGIYQDDLKTLETHVVYSISKEKAAVHLYIMQCTQTKQDMDLIPINDAMESLRGPLVIKESGSWITTPVVEYFHLLPFADKVSDWLSREGLLNTSQHFEVAREDGICNSSHPVESLPNTSQHVEAVKEFEHYKSSHLEVKPLPNISHHFETVKQVENHHSSQLKMEPLPNTAQSLETENVVGNYESSCLEVKLLSNTSHHLHSVKVENQSSSQSKLELLPNTSQCFEIVKEVENKGFELKVEQVLPNTSQYFEPVKEVEDYEMKPLSNTSNNFEAVKEVENNKNFHLMVEPLPNISPREAVKEVEDNDSSHVEVEPQFNASNHFEMTKEVKTSQPSAIAMEVKNGYCSNLIEEPLQYSSQHCEAAKDVKYENNASRKEKCTETVVYKKRNRSQKNCNSENPGCWKTNATTEYTREDDEKWALTGSSNDMDLDEALMTCSADDGKSKILIREDHDDKKQMILAEETDQTALTGGAIVVAEDIDNLLNSHEQSLKKVFSDNKISDTAMSDQVEKQDHALVSFNSNFEHLRKLQLTIASKEKLLSQTALKVLFRKREILSQQHRNIADELALCDRRIQTILNGGEDDLAVKIDSVIEGCNDICLRSVTTTEDMRGLHFLDQVLPPAVKRRRISEANLFVHCPCQELDGICNENSWELPTYHVSASEGGFEASVTVKGIDFECSSEGTVHDTPCEARNSAASKMLVKLRTMATES